MNPMEWYGVESMMNHVVAELKKITDASSAEISSALEGVEQQMSDLTTSVDELQAAVTGVSQRVDEKLGAALEALSVERAKFDSLVTAENAEDVAQDAELADARAATDAALTEARTAAGEISDAVSDLNAVAPADAPTEPEVPAEPAPEVPSEPEVPAEPTPEVPAEPAPAEPTS